jgi:hypothetical protein
MIKHSSLGSSEKAPQNGTNTQAGKGKELQLSITSHPTRINANAWDVA